MATQINKKRVNFPQKAYDVETLPIYIIENVGIFGIRSLFQLTLITIVLIYVLLDVG